MLQSTKEVVKSYYGKTLKSGNDLKTDACCTLEAPTQSSQLALKNIHEEVLSKYYGCGLVLPDVLKDLKVLDLGSGAGRDCFVLSQLVGEQGHITGVDMTQEQLETANKYIPFHMDLFGYQKSNVEFLKGDIEKLDQLNLAKQSFDLIVSNCVINLCENKVKVLSDAFNLLKEGGEFYFSDVYCNRKVPNELREDPLLYGECLGGALYWNDFLQLAKQTGFLDPRLVESRKLEISDPIIETKLKGYDFYSATYRLFKINDLEADCEDYGQTVTYHGGIEDAEQTFNLDSHHSIEKDKPFPVCGNSYKMLSYSRFKKYFSFNGDFSQHHGIFEGCGKNIPFNQNNKRVDSGNCC